MCEDTEGYICEYIMRPTGHLGDPFQWERGVTGGGGLLDSVEMYHNWDEATDDPNNMISILFLDY